MDLLKQSNTIRTTFKHIKSNIKLNKIYSSDIQPINAYPILYYLIDYVDKTAFLKTIQESTLKKLYIDFFNSKYSIKEFCKFMDNYGDKLKKFLYNTVNTSKHIKQIVPYTDDELQLYNEFISCEIQQDFESNVYQKLVYNIKYYDIEYGIEYGMRLILYTKKSISESKIKHLASLILLLKVYYKSTIKVDATLFLIPKNKKLSDSKFRVLGTSHINSGYCTNFNSKYSKLCVFRDEEMEKVILHEMCHGLKLDFNYIAVPKHLISKFNISPQTRILLNEAYTEIMAVSYNSIIKSSSMKELKQNLKMELDHTLSQIAKILNYYHFKDIYDFVKSYDGLNRFKQETSVFSYFFVKGGLLFHLHHFQLDKQYFNPETILEYSLTKDFLKAINKVMKKKDNTKGLRMTIV